MLSSYQHSSAMTDPVPIEQQSQMGVEDTVRALADTSDWQREFPRVELAWLAGRQVEDQHEAMHFHQIISSLRRASRHPLLPEEYLAQIDAVRSRYGDGFDYCRLAAALRRLHRPILDPVLLTVEMKKLHRAGTSHWH